MKKTLFAVLFLTFLVSGCSWFQTRDEESSDDLVSDGMYNYEDANYRRSIESFEKLKDWYPYSKYAILAELKIADAHYRLHEYDEAIAAYESFESLHPRNDAVPYVIYQIGTSYFEQIDTVDRDQTVAEKALAVYTRLVKQYPDDPYAAKAREHIKLCQKSLAGHEFYVGLFYYNSKHYRPALKRFKSVLANYPDVGIHQEAIRYTALCETRLQNDAGDTDADQKEASMGAESASEWPTNY